MPRQSKPAEIRLEANMVSISPQLFIVLFFFCFFGGMGIFFMGIGYLWQVSLQAKAMRNETRP